MNGIASQRCRPIESNKCRATLLVSSVAAMMMASMSSSVFLGCAPKANTTPRSVVVDPPARDEGADDGAAVGPNLAEASVEKLVALLADKSQPDIDRICAAAQIGRLDPDVAKKVLPTLRTHLRDKNDVVGTFVAVTMLKADPNDREALTILIGNLRSPDPNAREAAAEELGWYRRRAIVVVPALVDALKDDDVRVRELAAQSLGLFGPQAYSAVPALTLALADDAKEVRLQAAQALKEMPKDAESAVPALKKLLSDEDENVATQARLALDSIQREQSGKR